MVHPGGSKSFVQRLTIKGKRHDIGLGPFPLVTLREARERAFENRRTAWAGGDPLGDERKVTVLTFREAAQHTHQANLSRWRNDNTPRPVGTESMRGKDTRADTRRDKASGQTARPIRRARVSLYAGGRLNVSFSATQWEAVERAAEALGLPLVEVVRRATDAGLPKLRDADRKRRRRARS